MKQHGLISSFWLKIIMAVLMVADHLRYFLPGIFPAWLGLPGRIVAPTFAFLMTQSMVYTSHQGRFIRRMLLAGLVMLAGNTLLESIFGRRLSLDIFLSLAVSAAILYCCERLRQDGGGLHYALAIPILFWCSLYCEGSFLLPSLSLIFFYFRGNRPLMCGIYVLASPLLILLMGWTIFPQVLMVLAVIPILLSNGERGPDSPAARNFFYILYPAHIWLLYLIREQIIFETFFKIY